MGGRPDAEIFGSSLADPRVSIREADVGALIRSSASHFDAILLDVDNGPDGLTRKANDALYDYPGCTRRPSGITTRRRAHHLVGEARPEIHPPSSQGEFRRRCAQGTGRRLPRRQEAYNLDSDPLIAKAARIDYSIISVAITCSFGVMARPSALAVARLITHSNLLGSCTGRPAGRAPLRMRSTYHAARR